MWLVGMGGSFTKTPRCTLAKVSTRLFDRLKANMTVIRMFEVARIFHGAIEAVSFLSVA